jgi:hypothetical protein
MKKLSFIVCIIIWIGSSVHSGYSQPNEGFAYTRYSIDKGLPDHRLNDIVTDNDGYIWIASDNGVSRFDGYNFFNFSKNNIPNFFPNKKVDELYIHNENIYLFSKKEGCIKLNTKNLTSEVITREGIISFAIHKNLLYTLSENGNLTLHHPLIRIQKKFNLNSESQIISYKNHLFLNISRRIIYRLNPVNLDSLQSYNVTEEMGDGKYYHSNKYGLIYVTAVKNYAINPDLSYYLHPQLLNEKGVSFYTENIKKEILFVVNNKISYIIKNDTINVLELEKNNNIEIRKLLWVNDNCILLATNQGLVKLFRKDNISKHIYDQMVIDEKLIRVRRKIIEASDNKIYLAGYPGLVSLNKETNEIKNLFNINIPTYDAILIKNEIYLTTEGWGLIKYNLVKNKVEIINTKAIDNKDMTYHISAINDTILVVGGEGNIFGYNISNNHSWSINIPNKMNVYDIQKDIKNDILWIGGEKGLYLLKIKDFMNGEKIAFKNLNLNQKINDIYITSDQSNLIIATDNGIYTYKNIDYNQLNKLDSVYTLTHQKATRIIEDRNKKLWASTFYGITCIDLQNNKSYNILPEMGLNNFEFNYKSGTLLSNGKIMLGGIEGYDIIDAEKINFNQFSDSIRISGYKVVSEKLLNNFKFNINDDEITFKTGKEELQIFLSNINYGNSHEYKFEFNLNNNGWNKIFNNNIIRISNLSYGIYDLEIRMLDRFGTIINAKKIKINAVIPFYQKPYFYILILVVILGLILIIINNNVRKKELEFDIKKKIAMDLHDEVGTILTRLLFISKKEEKQNHQFSFVVKQLNEALFSLREFINNMTTTSFKFENLEDEIRDFFNINLNKTDIKTEIKITKDKDYLVNPQLFRDIKLCIFEITNNAVKHSHCSILNFNMTAYENCINIEICDNGIFKDESEITKRGNGIDNIHKRVKRNNGHILMKKNQAGNGLCYIIKFTL